MLNDTDLIRLNESYSQFPDVNPMNEGFAKVVEWAENIDPNNEIDAALYSLVMKGLIAVNWDDEEGQAVFTSTEKGRTHPQLYQGE